MAADKSAMNKRRRLKTTKRGKKAPSPGTNGRGNGRARSEQNREWVNESAVGYGYEGSTHDESAGLDIAPPGVTNHSAETHIAEPRTTSGRVLKNRRVNKPPPQQRQRRPQRSPQPNVNTAEAEAAVGMLTCVAGPEEGLGLTLSEGVYGIGRGRDNHFVLKDIAASRQHIEVHVKGGEVTVVDLGSGNGTRVNGKKIQQAALKPGDRVEIGNSAMTYTPLGQARKSRRNLSVPPKPAPRSVDLWPETETLLSELHASRSSVAARRHDTQPSAWPEPASKQQPARPRRPPAAPMPPPAAPAPAPLPGGRTNTAQSMEDIRAAIGSSQRFGSTGWLIGGASLIVLILGLAAMIFYLTQVRNSDEEQAKTLAMAGLQNMLQGRYADARSLFEQAEQYDPDNKTVAENLELLVRYEQSTRAYQRSMELMDDGDYEGARHALQGVVVGTPKYKEVDQARRRIDEAEASDLLQQARKKLKKNHFAEAERLAEKALVLEPKNSEARSLQEEIKQAAKPKEPEPQVAPQPPPQPQPKKTQRQVRRNRPQKSYSRPKPRPKPKRSFSLSDGEAKSLYREALQAYKADELKRARNLLNKIKRGTKPGNLYYEKATSFLVRKL